MGQKSPIWGKFGQFWGPPFWSQNPQTPQFWGPFKPPILGSKPPKSPHFGVPLESPHSRLHFRTPILGQKTPIWGKLGRFWGPPPPNSPDPMRTSGFPNVRAAVKSEPRNSASNCQFTNLDCCVCTKMSPKSPKMTQIWADLGKNITFVKSPKMGPK